MEGSKLAATMARTTHTHTQDTHTHTAQHSGSFPTTDFLNKKRGKKKTTDKKLHGKEQKKQEGKEGKETQASKQAHQITSRNVERSKEIPLSLQASKQRKPTSVFSSFFPFFPFFFWLVSSIDWVCLAFWPRGSCSRSLAGHSGLVWEQRSRTFPSLKQPQIALLN